MLKQIRLLFQKSYFQS